MNRIIGEYKGGKGKLVLVFAGIHGNEHAGIKALESLFGLLDQEALRNPNFEFKGKLVGVLGNLRATKAKKRYLLKDLNRQFDIVNVQRVKNTAEELLAFEDLELKELTALVENLIGEGDFEELIFLDLHTTTADGGFSVVTENPASVALAKALYVPVIKGLLKGVKGTSLHYFTTENLGVKTSALCLESGQHDDPKSVDRAVSALVSLLKAVGVVGIKDFGVNHETLLKVYAEDLPKVVELRQVHVIGAEDKFLMNPGYKNFDIIEKGEILASDKRGDILASQNGLILMPLYQKQGSEGFFIVESVE